MSSAFIRPVPTIDNLNSLLPPPPPGAINVIFQADQNNPRNVTAYFFQNSAGVHLVSTSTYTIQGSDQGKLVVFTAASASVIADSTLGQTFGTNVLFAGASGGTLSTTSGQINTQASLTFLQWGGGDLALDGTNWWLEGNQNGNTQGQQLVASFISGTSYTVKTSDQGKTLVFTSSSAVSVTLDSTLPPNFVCFLLFVGSAGGTATPSSGTVNGSTSLSFSTQYSGALVSFNGTNWFAGTLSGGSSGGVGTVFTVGLQGAQVGASAINYAPLSGVVGAFVLALNLPMALQTVAAAATAKNPVAVTNSAQPGTGSLVFELYDNTTSTLLGPTITIAAGAAAGVFTGTGTAALTAGHTYAWRGTNNASTASAQVFSISFQYS